MKSLAFASVAQLREMLSSREISVDELMDYTYARFARYNDDLGAALELFDRSSIEQLSSKESPLFGIPGLLKDNLCQKGRVTSCASKILEHFISPYDATVCEKLKGAGALVIGRANCDEFAMGSSNETSAYAQVHNPWDLACVPGGSSGGSAAAVAAGLVPWALGSDTGGSVRQPAAFCGVVGSKPTYGLISRYGLVAYASSLDTIGVLTRTVYDNALIMSQLVGPDGRDSTAIQHVKPVDYTAALTGKIKPGMKIAIIDNAFNAKGIDAGVKQQLENAVKELEKLGAQISFVSLPAMDHGAAVYFMISRAEAASNLSRFDGVRYGLRDKDAQTLTDMYEMTRAEGFGHEVKRRILIGNYVLSSGHADEYYKSARAVQDMIRQEFLDAFKNVDLLFMPTAPCTAFEIDAFKDNTLQMDLQDYFTAPINLVGLPSVSVPCGFVENMPVGFQLIGPDLSEQLIFQTAHAYEQQTPWHTMHPEWLA